MFCYILYSFLFRWWRVHAAGCRTAGCWDARRGGCGHLRQRPNGSPVPWGERAELCGTCYGLRRLLRALHELPSSPPHPHLERVCEHAFRPPVWPAWPLLFIQMTPNIHTHTHTQQIHCMHAAMQIFNALNIHTVHAHTFTVCTQAGKSECRDKHIQILITHVHLHDLVT